MYKYVTTNGLKVESNCPIDKGDVITLKYDGYLETKYVESVKDGVLELEFYNVQTVTVKY